MDRPSPEDRGPKLAEQRWLDVERRFTRHFALAALVLAAALVTTYVAANVGQLALARASCVAIFCGMARVIHLVIERRRGFIAVRMRGGMTREEGPSGVQFALAADQGRAGRSAVGGGQDLLRAGG